MQRSRSLIAILGLLSAPAACSDGEAPTGPVPPYLTMVTTQASYPAGDKVGMRMVNHSDFTLSFGPSSVLLEVLTGRGWIRPELAQLPCTDNLIGVLAHSEGTFPHWLPEGLSPGTYRIRLEHMYVVRQFGDNDGLVPHEQLTSNVFAIQ